MGLNMKRLFFNFLFLSILSLNLSFANNQNNNEDNFVVHKIEQSLDDLAMQVSSLSKLMKDQKDLGRLSNEQSSSVYGNFTVIFEKAGKTLNFIVDKCDRLTSKKFIISMFIIMGPMISLYCTYVNPDFVHNFLSYFFKSAAKGAVEASGPAFEGAVEGIIEGAMNNKLATAEFIGYTGGAIAVAKIFSEIVFQVGRGFSALIVTKLGLTTHLSKLR